jgi:putative resolvase
VVAGTLPTPAWQVSAWTILAEQPPPATGRVALYAQVSSHDQQANLDRQVARLSKWAATAGGTVACVEAEVASGTSGKRPRLRRLLVEAALAARGRRVAG